VYLYLCERVARVDDESVVASFLNIVEPSSPIYHTSAVPSSTSLLLDYLRHAKIGVIIGDLLFVHGALHPANVGYVVS